jgi:hypothetical protein
VIQEIREREVSEEIGKEEKLSRPPLNLSEIGGGIRVEVGRASRELRRRRRTREFPFQVLFHR